MREIKFRAWDGDKNEMHLPEYSDKEDFHILPDGNIVETHEHGYERHELTSKRPDTWVLMQYTGLKDKNGNEIYEGDIVKDSERVMIVSFGDLSFDEYAGTGWIVTGIPETDDNSFWLAPDEGFVLEIIGNIHTNPELLNP